MSKMQLAADPKIQVICADPSALGLFGLAMVTLVVSSQKLHFTHGLVMLLPWVIFLGAIPQAIACIYDLKRNNIFGATAFGAYALFWFAIAFSWMLKLEMIGKNLQAEMDPQQLGVAFIGYLIFSVFMTIGALNTNKVLFVIFLLIDLLFIGLVLNTFSILPLLAYKLAAYSELLISLFSFYASAGVVLNTHLKRIVLPLGTPFITVPH